MNEGVDWHYSLSHDIIACFSRGSCGVEKLLVSIHPHFCCPLSIPVERELVQREKRSRRRRKKKEKGEGGRVSREESYRV